ncbi:MAG TPA: energy transducer TonB [Croceibacterium sp.]|nr:energy transducer TonB [Croceibacterium sp.]
MAAFSHLRREEKLGLGVAVVLHVALVAGLLVEARRAVPVIPPAERMTVSLADDVSLESTAPNPSQESQAAVAPVIAPESEPLPAPVTEPIQPPVHATIERPVPQPKPANTPSPKATLKPKETAKAQPAPSNKSGGGSRIGADFLKGISSGERANASTPAATFGQAEAASLKQAIARQLKPHWQPPDGVDADKLVTIVRIWLNKDGTLNRDPVVVSQGGITPSNGAQKGRHAEQAIRAVRLAAPFDLPPQFYDQWKVINSRFDFRLSQ